jgi:hypothetical protein
MVMTRVFKVTYEPVADLSKEEAEKLQDFLYEYITEVENKLTHFYVSEGFDEELDEEMKQEHSKEIELLKKLENTEIVLVW